MAVSTPSLLFPPTPLTAVATVIYTVPASPPSTTLGRGRVRFTNTSGGSRTITAYAVPSSGIPNSSTCFALAEAIPMNSHLDLDLPVLAAGATFQALADVTLDVTVFQLDGILFS